MAAQKQILVVEDNEINRAMLREILCGDYRVLEAENGQEALDLLKAHGEEIALVLLDIVMPVMDGYTFLSLAKADPELRSVPVIVVTQSGSESDEVTALSHGAADFVAKPYKPQIILHRVASIIDLRENAAMINLFQHDRLTGLYTKEFFYKRAWELLLQHPERRYDIVCSDVENFKLINDVFGVPAGDRLLKGMADLYVEMVGELGICARFNADRFGCLLEHRVDYEDEMFIQAEARMNALTNMKKVIIKWGVYPVEHDRSVSIEQMCDRALLSARSIRGQYGRYFAPYDDELRSRLLQEKAITDKMETALAQEQFVVYLQPKYSIRSHRMAGAEALVRWDHPERGLLPPAEFIPLFEKSGFITRLDQYVWDKTCALLRRWADQGLPALPVSVNVSRADVYQTDLADVLTRTVEKYGLPTAVLHLEITESAYTEDPEQLIATVRQLRRLGFVIEMDDFGSGYSSLNMLNQMPLDVLKLDMKFIQSETAKPEGQGILNFIMGLARWMNLSVAAEGVETLEQLERLRNVGCDYVQGYYFAQPMSSGAFESLMREQAGAGASSPREEDELPVLLVADGDAGYRGRARRSFGDRYEVVEAENGAEALDRLAALGQRAAAVLLELPPAGGDGLLDALRRVKPSWRLSVVGTAPPETEGRSPELEAAGFACGPRTQAGPGYRGGGRPWEEDENGTLSDTV